MALFTINRYMGDEVSEKNEKNLSQAQEILRKIHKQASLRGRTKSQGSESTEEKSGPVDIKDQGKLNETPEADNVSPSKKRKRKTPNEAQYQSTESVETIDDTNTPKGGGKSKKRKKAEDIDSPEETQLSPETLKKKKKAELKKQKAQTESEEKTEGLKNKGKKKKVKERRHSETLNDATEEVEEEGAEQKDKVLDKDEEDEEETNAAQSMEDEQVEGQSHKEVGGFTIIGDVHKKKTEKVHRVLPDWLANPSVVTNNLRDSSGGLDVSGLDGDLLQKLRDNGITYFFPVQRLVIPVLLGGYQVGHLIGPAAYQPRDICCSAPTGSGKTLAFVLPIIQALRCRVVRQVRALVVLPVRDLACQVHKVFTTYCKGTNLKVALLVGQKPFSMEQQSLVRKGPRGPVVQADIVVATPGRLVDHIKQTQGFSLHHLRYLVIDEADRMMDQIKQDWLTQVEQAVYNGNTWRQPPGPLSAATASRQVMPLQKLLFSATLSQNPEKLQQLNLFQPRLFTSVVIGQDGAATTLDGRTSAVDNSQEDHNIEKTSKRESSGETGEHKTRGEFVGKYTTPEELTEQYVRARDVGSKPLLLLHFLLHRKLRHVLCFTNSVEATHRLYHLIRIVGGLQVREFSSNLHAEQRSRILKRFAAGKIDVLICSDAMARGMDVENVECVFSYDSAPYVKTYIHRVGRTARAGRPGTAITLLHRKEVSDFKRMIKEAGKNKVEEVKVEETQLESLLPDYQRALESLNAILKAEKAYR